MDLIRDHVDSFILRFLAQGDSYGYDIHKAISTATEGVYEIKQPTLYSCLKRLEKQGFITSYDGETSNGAQRKYYSITEKGRDYLNVDIEQWEFSRTLLDRLLSDKQIDLSTVSAPFDPSGLRPRTKRGSGVAAAAITTLLDDSVDDASQSEIDPAEAQEVVAESENADNSVEKFGTTFSDAREEELASESVSSEENTSFSYDPVLHATQLDIDSYIEDTAEPEKKPILQDFLRSHMGSGDDYLSPLSALYEESSSATTSPAHTQEEQGEEVLHQNAFNYGELKDRAQAEGYRLHPYSKAVSTSYYSMNFIFSARLRRDSLLLLYFVMFIEVLVSYFALDRYAGLGYVFYLVVGCILLLCPIAGVVLYLIKPDKRIRAEFDLKSSISGMIMLMINLFILSMLFGFFLFHADLARPATMIKPILYPSLLFIDFPIYTLIYAALYNTRRYHLK